MNVKHNWRKREIDSSGILNKTKEVLLNIKIYINLVKEVIGKVKLAVY